VRLAGNTVLITGGSAGIGLALAEGFAARGSRVLVCGRDPEKLRRAEARVPGLAWLAADVAVAADRRRLLAWVEDEHPDVNVLVNNAGLQIRARVAEGPAAVDTGEIATNLAAPIELAALFLPRLLALAQRGVPAAIVNVTSGLGYVPLAATPVYGATKAGLQAFTHALRHQLRGTGVHVVDLAPPAVDTALLRGAQTPTQTAEPDVRQIPARGARGGPPTMTPEAFAVAALDAMARGRTEVRVGGAQLLYVLNRLAPHAARRLLNHLAS
jgi:uncharacterized oxidoreductase